jgi:hypothetical protein
MTYYGIKNNSKKMKRGREKLCRNQIIKSIKLDPARIFGPLQSDDQKIKRRWGFLT